MPMNLIRALVAFTLIVTVGSASDAQVTTTPKTAKTSKTSSPSLPWKTSWEKFTQEISPLLADRAFGSIFAHRFEGKMVTWEGTVPADGGSAKSLIPNTSTSAFHLEVTPSDTKVRSGLMKYQGVEISTISIQKEITVFPKAGTAEAWKVLVPGARIQFRGVLATPVYQLISGANRMFYSFSVHDAEIIVPGSVK
jgi:hypothetical protein